MKSVVSGVALILATFVMISSLRAKVAHAGGAEVDNLTRDQAVQRRAQISSVGYDLHFVFAEQSKTYQGVAKIAVDLVEPLASTALVLDYKGKKPTSVKINGASVKNYTHHAGKLEIPRSMLKASNAIEIQFTNGFSVDGNGFQRFVDPEDKSVYLATDFEPYHAHHFFPCFDQPDIKAKFNVSVEAPRAWKIIANSLPAETKEINKQTQFTKFRPTPPISTYLMFVGADPYIEWSDTYGDLPLVIYARQALAKYVDSERLFRVTKQGLKFFNDYFGYPYPFEKYGQIFIPEFASGGMENPGAVALSETNIFRGPVSQARMDGRDNLILHEMAHMWFGDLVTMKWWDDLWLNESFASYIASVALERAAGSKGAWTDFYQDKTWGYWQDQLRTTHPIEAPVPDVKTATGNFDGITYAKGASALKQLHYFLGEEGFRKGLREYFKKFAFQNTVRADFISTLAKAAGVDLDGWTSAWLQSAGPHRVSVDFTCDNGVVKNMTLNQKPNFSGVYSPHKTRVGLFSIDGAGKVKAEKVQDVSYSKDKETLSTFVGSKCPQFVYPNVHDQDYALSVLDPVSLKAAGQILESQDSDPLLRFMLWNDLAQMVRDAEFAMPAYLEMAIKALQKEKSEEVLGSILNRYSPLNKYFYSYLSVEQRQKLAPQLEDVLWQRLEAADATTNEKMMFFDFYVRIAHSDQAREKLLSALQATAPVAGVTIDQDRRWAILVRLARMSDKQARQLIALEKKKDRTALGEREGYAAQVALPEKAAKESFWKDVLRSEKVVFSHLRAGSRAFNDYNHPDLGMATKQKFFEQVRKMDWEKNDHLVDLYFEGLFPHSVCSHELLKESEKQLGEHPKLTSLVKRAWLEANEELEHCISARQKSSVTR